MKLKTVRVRRSRPSAPALALALMITMLCVYLLTLGTRPEADSRQASAAAPAEAQLRMEGMEVRFACESWCDDPLEARVLAARCAESGGAGLVLENEGRWAVVRGIEDNEGAEAGFRRSGPGLTLNLRGPAGEITAIAEAIDFLYALARETGSMADALERGESDAGTTGTLLELYRTRGQRSLDALRGIQSPGPVPARLAACTERALERINAAIASPAPGALRLLHTAACADWLDTLNAFAAAA